jgi:hypothetical protein
MHNLMDKKVHLRLVEKTLSFQEESIVILLWFQYFQTMVRDKDEFYKTIQNLICLFANPLGSVPLK